MNSINYPPPSLNVWQTRFELEWLLTVFKAFAPRNVLELGSADGGTLWAWSHNCEPGTRITSVDWYHPEYVDNRALYPAWAEEGRCEIAVVAGDTREPATLEAVAARAPFDWLFIDAGHAWNEVHNDWVKFGPLVRRGAVVFHDIAPNPEPNVDVTKLWTELKKVHPHLEILHDWRNCRCGVGVLFVN
jgi:predicted O-methyltransferase YrrM